MINRIVFKDKEIYSRDTRLLGFDGENKQQILQFEFESFINGIARLDLEFENGQKGFLELEKDLDNEVYRLEVQSSLLANVGEINMQIVIVKDNVEVYKTKPFVMYVAKSINATETIEEQYPNFVDTTNAKLSNIEKSLENKVDKEYVDKSLEDIEIPTKISDLENDEGYLKEYKETDPTVPEWAKKPEKPSYTAEEVGALSKDTELFDGDYNSLKNKPNDLATETFVQEKINEIDIGNKVDKENGKSLSTNDFTNEYKTKLDGLENYDDTKINEKIRLLEENSSNVDNEVADLLKEYFEGIEIIVDDINGTYGTMFDEINGMEV